jgi:mannose/fructose/N-acetylgalactosamine-specific phosphotransferase system component IIB
MIKLTRIDDRLVHGQVVFTWVPSLGVDCLLIANDKVAQDDFQKMTLGLAKPAGVKLIIRSLEESVQFLNDDKNRSLKVLILINSVADAFALSNEVPEIKSINFGGIRFGEGKRLISKSVAMSENDTVLIRTLLEKGVELEVRQVPTDKKQMSETLI